MLRREGLGQFFARSINMVVVKLFGVSRKTSSSSARCFAARLFEL